MLHRQLPNVPLQPLQAKQCDIEIAAHYSLLFHQNSINGKRDEVQNIQRKGRSIAPPVAETKLNVVCFFYVLTTDDYWLLIGLKASVCLHGHFMMIVNLNYCPH